MRNQMRWGPCQHCSAEGWWDPSKQHILKNPLYDHDRPQGGRCLLSRHAFNAKIDVEINAKLQAEGLQLPDADPPCGYCREPRNGLHIGHTYVEGKVTKP